MLKKKSNTSTGKPNSAAEQLQHHATQVLKAANRLPEPKKQEETIHKFRVNSRRLETLYRLSRGLSRSQSLKKLYRKVRQVRKKLGTIRDWDVHRALWKKLAQGNPSYDKIDRLLEKGRGKALRKFLKKAKIGKLKKAAKKLPKRANQESNFFNQIPKEDLVANIDRLFSSYQQYQQNKQVDLLHQFRIDLKKLRYSLEALQGYSTARLGYYLPALKKIQDELGYIHDLEMLGLFLKKILKEKKKKRKVREALEKICQKIDRERAQSLEKWVRQWPEKQRLLISILNSLHFSELIDREAS